MLVSYLETAISLLKKISEHPFNHPNHGDHLVDTSRSNRKTFACGVAGHCLQKPQAALGIGHASQEGLHLYNNTVTMLQEK